MNLRPIISSCSEMRCWNISLLSLFCHRSTGSDEMCNMYLMYYTPNKKVLKEAKGCWGMNTITKIPETAMDLAPYPGFAGQGNAGDVDSLKPWRAHHLLFLNRNMTLFIFVRYAKQRYDNTHTHTHNEVEALEDFQCLAPPLVTSLLCRRRARKLRIPFS